MTYGTAKEFGFDFLRDRLLLRRISEGQADFLGGMLGHTGESGEKPVQGAAYFVLVDEADSMLIDEARTPLIISAFRRKSRSWKRNATSSSRGGRRQIVDEDDYEFDPRRSRRATTRGRQKARRSPSRRNWTPWAWSTSTIRRAGDPRDRESKRDRQYVVRDGEMVIVDEFTGRLIEGRSGTTACTRRSKRRRAWRSPRRRDRRPGRPDFFSAYENLAE